MRKFEVALGKFQEYMGFTDKQLVNWIQEREVYHQQKLKMPGWHGDDNERNTQVELNILSDMLEAIMSKTI